MITNNYWPYRAGVVRSIDAFADQLRRLGHTVSIITLDFEKDYASADGVYRLFCPIKFRYYGNPMAVPLAQKKQLANLLNILKPDIIHVHHPFLLGWAGLRCSQALLIPIVFTYHTLYEHYVEYVPLPSSVVKRFVTKRVKYFCNTVNGIVAPSQYVKECVRSFGNSTPLVVIPSPMARSFCEFAGGRNSIEAPIELLTVSRFVKEKNIDFLLQAFSYLDPVRFRLTLIGYGPCRQELESYAFERLGLSRDTVRFVSGLSDSDLVEYYRTSHLFLFSSVTETQGIVLAEALSQGLPIIACDGPGIRDAVLSGVNGLVVNSPVEMGNAIVRVVGDQESYIRFSQEAYRRSLLYRPERATSELVDFYYAVQDNFYKMSTKR